MKKISANVSAGPVTKTVEQIFTFSNQANQWLQQLKQRRQQRDASVPENPLPLELAISQLAVSVNNHFKELNELGIERNKTMEEIELKHASSVKIIKGGQNPQVMKEMMYEPAAKFAALEKEMKDTDASFFKRRAELLAKEVEMIPVYAASVPNSQILPPAFVSAFRGFVIRKEYVSPDTK